MIPHSLAALIATATLTACGTPFDASADLETRWTLRSGSVTCADLNLTWLECQTAAP